MTDFMTLIRAVLDIPETFPTWKLTNMNPKGHCRVDVVADSYFMASIKDAELVVIKSAKSKECHVLAKFLWSSGNKPKTIQLVFETTEEERKKICNALRQHHRVSRK